MDAERFLALADQQKWTALAALIISWLVRLMSNDTKLPIAVPDRWKPVVVLALGQVYGVLQSVLSGKRWPEAVVQGLVASGAAFTLYAAVVKSIWGDDAPPWAKALALVPYPAPKPAEKAAGPTSPN